MKSTFTRYMGLFILLICPFVAQSQELSTLGKTFWMTFMESIGTPNNAPQLKIVISCNKATTGTVKNFISGVTMPFSIGVGGGVDTVLVSTTAGYTTGSENASSRNAGLIITAKDTVSVAAQNTKTASCDAALIYPIEALGVDYRVVSFPGDIYSGGGTNSTYRSTFAIVATENGTTIDITPTCATVGGKAANTTFTITLQKGETYQVIASSKLLDLSGTLVQARDCKKIAVFGGSNRSVIVHPTCSSGVNSADHLYEQMMPMNLWGKKFAFIPTTWKPNTLRRVEMVKFVTSQNNTRVTFNGRNKIISTAGMTDTFFLVTTGNNIKDALVTANKPIALCQLGLSQRCDGGSSDTDPMLMWLSPLEQTLKNLNFSCENADKIDKFFINVVVKTSSRNQLKIDGVSPTATWQLLTKDTSYSYIQQSGLALGNHNMSHPLGFFAILYAYGDYGSYGYSVGSSIKPLSFYSFVNGKSSADFESDSLFYTVCEDATVPFDGGGSSLTGVTWKWLCRDASGAMMPNFPKAVKNFTYLFKDTGRYKVNMIAQRPTNGVCNGLTSIDDTVSYEIRVYKRPDIKLMKDTTICFGNSFKITSKTDGDTLFTFSPSTWLNCTKCYQPISKPLKDTAYYVTATRFGCSPSRDTMRVFVRDSFFMTTSTDTTICRGTSTTMSATVWGGLSSNLVVNWDNGLGVGLSHTVAPKATTTYRAILTDGCSKDANGNQYADTAYIVITVRDSLKITMPRDTLVCEGNDVTLTATVAGGVVTSQIVNWDNGLGSGLSKTVTLGSSDVTYKAVLSDGCTNPNDSGYVTVKVRPGMKIDTIMYNNPVCKNQTFNISARASGGDSTGYIFKLYNTSTSGFVLIDSSKGKTYPSFNLNIPDDQTYSLRLNQVCNAQQTSKKIAIKIKTGLNITNPTPVDTICTNRTYNLKINGTSADNLPIKFVLKRKVGANWVAQDSTVNASQASFNINPPASPSDYLIIGNDNCSRNDSTTFKIYTRTPVSIGALVGDELCRNEAITLTASPAGGRVQSYTYRWYDVLSNATLGTQKSITYTPSQSMDIGVVLSDGCSDSVKTTTRLWVAPQVTDSLLATKIDGCEPLSTLFFYPKTAAQTPLNPSFTWKWYFDNINSVNTPSDGGTTHADIPKSYNTAGIYNTRVSMALGNGKICFSKAQSVQAYVQASADFSYLPRQIDIVEPEVSFTDLSTGADGHVWKFGDGGFDGVQNPKHTYTDTGLYTVMMVATTIHGCNDTTYQKLRVLDIYRIFIPNAFSPNKDEFNTAWEPKFTSILSLELNIFNRWGERIYYNGDNTGRWDGTYNGVECPEGVYYYHIKVRDNRRKWHYYSGMISLIR